ncbi:unnamed protein product [Pylaiella littoralis]
MHLGLVTMLYCCCCCCCSWLLLLLLFLLGYHDIMLDWQPCCAAAVARKGWTCHHAVLLLLLPLLPLPSLSLLQEQMELATMLCEHDQAHLMDGWPMPGTDDDEKHAFFKQVKTLHETYPAEGGLATYIGRAKELLVASQKGSNPLSGWKPSVPEGQRLELGTEQYDALEKQGLDQVKYCGFVLVAGGLGERLGYGDIKLRLPSESCTMTPYLQLYISQILHLQASYGDGRKLPLAIMVSDDTRDRTQEMLEQGGWFGMEEDQVTLMKQEKVAAIQDSTAALALDPDDSFSILTKPHGHGDVHALMHGSGTANSWREAGCKWVVFMQDTNGLALHTLAAVLGVSESMGLEVNSMAVPRKAKQAVGGIAKLKHGDGRQMTLNVEYNQLDPLLREGEGEGDVNDPDTGFSPYPGNINQLVFALDPYSKVLEETRGMLDEFVNPKYADAEKMAFKKPTRLECMMQDYPKSLGSGAKVGFTSVDPWLCFSPCKNNTADAAKAQASGTPPAAAVSAESDQYWVWAEMMRRAGCKVDQGAEEDWDGVAASLGPQIVFGPHFSVFYAELKRRFPKPSAVSVTAGSTLLVTGGGDVTIEGLTLDGALVIEVETGASLVIRNLVVKNDGWVPTSLAAAAQQRAGAEVPEAIQIRGFCLDKRDSHLIRLTEGDRVVDDQANPDDAGVASG